MLMAIDLPDVFDISDNIRVADVETTGKHPRYRLVAAVIMMPVELEISREFQVENSCSYVIAALAIGRNRVL